MRYAVYHCQYFFLSVCKAGREKKRTWNSDFIVPLRLSKYAFVCICVCFLPLFIFIVRCHCVVFISMRGNFTTSRKSQLSNGKFANQNEIVFSDCVRMRSVCMSYRQMSNIYCNLITPLIRWDQWKIYNSLREHCTHRSIKWV